MDELARENTVAGGQQIVVRFGYGGGLSTPRVYGTTGTMPISVLGSTLSSGQQIRQDSTAGFGGGFDFTFGLGPFCVGGCWVVVGPGSHYDNSVTLSDVDLTDVNGDGLLDSVTRCNLADVQASRCTSGEDLRVRYNQQRRTGLLKKVTNPLGGTFTLDYQMAGNTTVHPDSSWVLSEVIVDDGRPGNGADTQRSRISYTGPRYDFVNREDLGFAEVVTRQLDTENPSLPTLRTTRETFSNTNVFNSGLPKSVEVYSGDYSPGQTSNLLTSTTSTWEIKSSATDQNLPSSLTANQQLTSWARPLRTMVEAVKRYDGSNVDQVSRTRYTYDVAGNITVVKDEGDVDDASDDVTTSIVWSNCDNAANDEVKLECGPIAKPELRPAFWSQRSCPTWVQAPAIIRTTGADGSCFATATPARTCAGT